MARSSSNLVNNFAKGNHKIKSKCGHDNKNVERMELYRKIVSAALNTQALKMI